MFRSCFLRPSSRRFIVLLASAAWLAPGCGNSDTGDGNGGGVSTPTAPDYIAITAALGIQKAMDRVANHLPAYLDSVPGVDGEGPFQVEHFSDVPFRPTPQRLLTIDVYRPITGDKKLRRAVVLYMGGGYVLDLDFNTIGVWAQYLASRGIVAFNTRQRLLTEPNVTRRDVFADAIAAARFAAQYGQTYGADPNRLSVMGRSSGGQLAMLVGMVPSPDFFGPSGDPAVPVNIKAIVDLFGDVDDRLFFTTDDFSLLPHDALAAVYGGTPDEVPEAYAESAPLTYVRPGLPPIMIVHGELDTTVPISQSIRLADALEAAGDEVIRVFYQDYGHVIGWGLFNNDGFGQTIPQVIRFFESKL